MLFSSCLCYLFSYFTFFDLSIGAYIGAYIMLRSLFLKKFSGLAFSDPPPPPPHTVQLSKYCHDCEIFKFYYISLGTNSIKLTSIRECRKTRLAVADPGFGGRGGGGVNCHKQGRSPWSRHEVTSGGWLREGGGGGVPLPMLKKMEIRKCLEDFWSTPKSVYCKAMLYINIDKTHF